MAKVQVTTRSAVHTRGGAPPSRSRATATLVSSTRMACGSTHSSRASRKWRAAARASSAPTRHSTRGGRQGPGVRRQRNELLFR